MANPSKEVKFIKEPSSNIVYPGLFILTSLLHVLLLSKTQLKHNMSKHTAILDRFLCCKILLEHKRCPSASTKPSLMSMACVKQMVNSHVFYVTTHLPPDLKDMCVKWKL